MLSFDAMFVTLSNWVSGNNWFTTCLIVTNVVLFGMVVCRRKEASIDTHSVGSTPCSTAAAAAAAVAVMSEEPEQHLPSSSNAFLPVSSSLVSQVDAADAQSAPPPHISLSADVLEIQMLEELRNKLSSAEQKMEELKMLSVKLHSEKVGLNNRLDVALQQLTIQQEQASNNSSFGQSNGGGEAEPTSTLAAASDEHLSGVTATLVSCINFSERERDSSK